MKSKNIVRFICVTLLLLFTIVYLTQAFDYERYSNNKVNYLTEKQIKSFESNLKKGKKIKAKDYLGRKVNYNNKISRGGMALSNIIEKSFNGIMSFLFSEVNKAVND